MNVVAYWIVIRVTEWDEDERHLCVEYLSSKMKITHPDNWWLTTLDDEVRRFDTEESANYAIAQYGDELKLIAVPVNFGGINII